MQQVSIGRFIGRAEELARLRDLLTRAAAGEPLVALIGGEAGVGKTRLVEQLAAGVHVSNILAKLGVANRVEAAAAAHRLGLDRE